MCPFLICKVCDLKIWQQRQRRIHIPQPLAMNNVDLVPSNLMINLYYIKVAGSWECQIFSTWPHSKVSKKREFNECFWWSALHNLKFIEWMKLCESHQEFISFPFLSFVHSTAATHCKSFFFSFRKLIYFQMKRSE